MVAYSLNFKSCPKNISSDNRTTYLEVYNLQTVENRDFILLSNDFFRIMHTEFMKFLVQRRYASDTSLTSKLYCYKQLALCTYLHLAFSFLLQLGMSSATETLCGQAFGAKQYHMMGIYLQRSWIVDAVVATILTPLFIFATPLFILLGQEEEVAIAAGNVSLWFIPILYCYVFILTIQMYLQAQLKNMIVGWLSASSFVLHLLLSWIFVTKLNLGVPGAMGSMIISMWSMVIGELVYILGGWCPKTWRGFTIAAFTDLLPAVKLSISSGFMLW